MFLVNAPSHPCNVCEKLDRLPGPGECFFDYLVYLIDESCYRRWRELSPGPYVPTPMKIHRGTW